MPLTAWKNIEKNKHPPIDLYFNFQTMYLIFAGYTGSKNQVQNRQKIKFVELDFLN